MQGLADTARAQAEQAPHGRLRLRNGHRLDHHLEEATGAQGIEFVARGGGGDRDRRRVGAGAQGAQAIEAGAIGKVRVHQPERMRAIAGQPCGRGDVLGDIHLRRHALEGLRKELEADRVVFDQEQAG